MAQITPNSQVWLCNDVPLDPNYDNTMTFTQGIGSARIWNTTAQINYFMSKSVYSTTKFTPVKERGGVLRMTGMAENQFSMYNINYMVFTNTNFDNKYFYAFITKIQYINPGTTFIYFVLDEIQTWMPDLVWMESNIEREHVEDDTIFKNIEDEGIAVQDRLGYGDIYNFESELGQKIIVLGSTEPIISYENATETVYYNPQFTYPYNIKPVSNIEGLRNFNISNVVSYPSKNDLSNEYTGYYDYPNYNLYIKLNYNYITFNLSITRYGNVHNYNIEGERKPGTNQFKFTGTEV